MNKEPLWVYRMLRAEGHSAWFAHYCERLYRGGGVFRAIMDAIVGRHANGAYWTHPDPYAPVEVDTGDGFCAVVTFPYDDRAPGTYTDDPRGGAVQNPAWDYRLYRPPYRYYVPDSGGGVGEVADGLRRYSGMARGPAWEKARRLLVAEAGVGSDDGDGWRVVRVDVTHEAIPGVLSWDSRHEMNPNDPVGLAETAMECAGDALSQARAKLEAIRASLCAAAV